MTSIENSQIPEDERQERLTTADIAAGAKSRIKDKDRSFAAAPATSSERDMRPDGAPDMGPLFQPADAERLRSRWTDIQAGFVDEPRLAVEQADSLVAESIKRLAELFSDERAQLEGQWGRGDDVSTEDLRQALRRYRSFFSRLLAV